MEIYSIFFQEQVGARLLGNKHVVQESLSGSSATINDLARWSFNLDTDEDEEYGQNLISKEAQQVIDMIHAISDVQATPPENIEIGEEIDQNIRSYARCSRKISICEVANVDLGQLPIQWSWEDEPENFLESIFTYNLACLLHALDESKASIGVKVSVECDHIKAWSEQHNIPQQTLRDELKIMKEIIKRNPPE